MQNYYVDLKTQLTSLINEPVADHVDFRLGIRNFDRTTADNGFIDFYGPQEVDLLLERIEPLATSSGDWPLSTAYDALLLLPGRASEKKPAKYASPYNRYRPSDRLRHSLGNRYQCCNTFGR